MYPTLAIPWLDVSVRAHVALHVLGYVATLALAYRWIVVCEGLDRGRVGRALLLVVLAAVIGGRAYYVILNWSHFAGDAWKVLNITSAGFHAPALIAAGAMASVVILRRLQLPLGSFLDAFAPAVAFGVAIGRLGCYLHGCCFSTVCDYRWGVSFPKGTFIYNDQMGQGLLAPGAPEALPVHPLPLYFALSGLATAAYLLCWQTRKRYVGEPVLIALTLFGLSLVALEPLRGQQALYPRWGPMSHLWWTGLAMTMVSIIVLAAAEYRQRAAVRRPDDLRHTKPFPRCAVERTRVYAADPSRR